MTKRLTLASYKYLLTLWQTNLCWYRICDTSPWKPFLTFNHFYAQIDRCVILFNRLLKFRWLLRWLMVTLESAARLNVWTRSNISTLYLKYVVLWTTAAPFSLSGLSDSIFRSPTKSTYLLTLYIDFNVISYEYTGTSISMFDRRGTRVHFYAQRSCFARGQIDPFNTSSMVSLNSRTIGNTKHYNIVEIRAFDDVWRNTVLFHRRGSLENRWIPRSKQTSELVWRFPQ